MERPGECGAAALAAAAAAAAQSWGHPRRPPTVCGSGSPRPTRRSRAEAAAGCVGARAGVLGASGPLRTVRPEPWARGARQERRNREGARGR